MRYYKAYETINRPFLLFDLVAESYEELQNFGMETDPLVVSEDRLINPDDPAYISYEYGICSHIIFNNELVLRPPSEITAQQNNLSKAAEVIRTKKLSTSLETDYFSFGGKDFPMTPGAITVYNAVFESAPANRILITSTGNYTLQAADIPDFKAAYLSKVLNVQLDFSADTIV